MFYVVLFWQSVQFTIMHALHIVRGNYNKLNDNNKSYVGIQKRYKQQTAVQILQYKQDTETMCCNK